MLLHFQICFNSIWSMFSLVSSKSKKQCFVSLNIPHVKPMDCKSKWCQEFFRSDYFLNCNKSFLYYLFSGVIDENLKTDKNGTVLLEFQIISIKKKIGINKTYITWNYLFMYKNLCWEFMLVISTSSASACFTFYKLAKRNKLLTPQIFFSLIQA